MIAGHYSVLRIKNHSWKAGFGKDKTKGNYIVGQKSLSFEVTWQDHKKAKFEPFVNEHGHQGIRVLVE